MPILLEQDSTLFGIMFRFACPVCEHKSASFRSTQEEARKLWNRTCRIWMTKMKKNRET